MKELHIEVIDRKRAAILAAMTPAERIAIACEINRTVRDMVRSLILLIHPHWSDEERHREFIRIMLGKDAEPYLASLA
jgi:hypothetical protein